MRELIGAAVQLLVRKALAALLEGYSQGRAPHLIFEEVVNARAEEYRLRYTRRWNRNGIKAGKFHKR